MRPQGDVLMDIQPPACPELGTDGGILNYASVTLSYFNVIITKAVGDD